MSQTSRFQHFPVCLSSRSITDTGSHWRRTGRQEACWWGVYRLICARVHVSPLQFSCIRSGKRVCFQLLMASDDNGSQNSPDAPPTSFSKPPGFHACPCLPFPHLGNSLHLGCLTKFSCLSPVRLRRSECLLWRPVRIRSSGNQGRNLWKWHSPAVSAPLSSALLSFSTRWQREERRHVKAHVMPYLSGIWI